LLMWSLIWLDVVQLKSLFKCWSSLMQLFVSQLQSLLQLQQSFLQLFSLAVEIVVVVLIFARIAKYIPQARPTAAPPRHLIGRLSTQSQPDTTNTKLYYMSSLHTRGHPTTGRLRMEATTIWMDHRSMESTIQCQSSTTQQQQFLFKNHTPRMDGAFNNMADTQHTFTPIQR